MAETAREARPRGPRTIRQGDPVVYRCPSCSSKKEI